MKTHLASVVVAALLSPGFAQACWERAAQKHAVPVPLLMAVAQAESSLNPRAVNRSHFGKTNTVDIGIMQINSHRGMLKSLGVTADQLFDTCTNIDVGARILAEKMAKYGRTWEAVGAYNASCATLTPQQCLRVRMRYAWRVYRYLVRANARSADAHANKVPAQLVHARLG